MSKESADVLLKKKRGNYLVVVHEYFVHHVCWRSKILIDVTDKEAKGEASLWADKYRDNCNDAAGTAFLLPDTIVIQKDTSNDSNRR